MNSTTVKKVRPTDGRANRAGKELTLDMIKKDNAGYPVAMYLFKPMKRSGLSIAEMAKFLGYGSHSNMSMVRSGSARLPITKAPVMAEMLEMKDLHEFGMLVLENNMPKETIALKEMGVLCDKQERILLDFIGEQVAIGDRKSFFEKVKQLAKES